MISIGVNDFAPCIVNKKIFQNLLWDILEFWWKTLVSKKTCDFDEENIFFNIKAVLEKKQKQKNKFYRYTWNAAVLHFQKRWRWRRRANLVFLFPHFWSHIGYIVHIRNEDYDLFFVIWTNWSQFCKYYIDLYHIRNDKQKPIKIR